MTNKWSKEVFSKNLQIYMERSGKTQKELAEIIGVKPPTFHEWVKGKKFPRIDKVQKLADYFGILKSDLIEEKLTDEQEKEDDVFVDVIVRMNKDADFRALVESLYHYDTAKIQGIRQMLQAFGD